MSMRTLETAILNELRAVANRRSIRKKDIAEWSTGEVKVQDGETLFRLPGLQINVAVLNTALGKAKK